MVTKRKSLGVLLLTALVALGGLFVWLRAAFHVSQLPPVSPNWRAVAENRGAQASRGSTCEDPARNVEVPCPSTGPMVSAAQAGDLEGVKTLLNRRVDSKTLTDALFAAASSAPGTAKPLPNESHGFHYAEIARALLEKGAIIDVRDQEGGTPLMAAAGNGEDDVVQVLLDHGAAVNGTQNQGKTALIVAACRCESIDQPDTSNSMRQLLEHGADLEVRDQQGRTALMTAALWGRRSQLQLLIDWRAHIDAKDRQGNTALMLAASGGAYPTADAVELLLRSGAHIEARNDSGDTPLILAASSGGSEDLKIVRLLLSHGANPHAQDKQGQTALAFSLKNGRGDLAALLEGTAK